MCRLHAINSIILSLVVATSRQTYRQKQMYICADKRLLQYACCTYLLRLLFMSTSLVYAELYMKTMSSLQK